MSDINDTQSLSGYGSATSTGQTGKQQAVAAPPVLAGFEILNKIGQGGMGSVFRARQVSMDRIVALKILPKRLAQDPQFKERFVREARLSAKLNHVNLINGIECGESNGYTFFAMEYVDGRTAKQCLEQTQVFAPDQVLAIIRQISEALQYAHSRSLIHRDVKPENIMVTSSGQAKLCDLGLARSMEDSASDAHLTQAGQAVGTPFYISPEQAKGLKDLDARTDIYSLGATFYHLLSGQPPFQAPTSAAVMVKHLTESAPAVSEVADDVPVEYAMVVSKMMAKAPSDRYPDMGAVLRDLDAIKSGKLPTAAEFRGKSSCAMPSRTAKRVVADASTASRKTTPIGPSTGRAKTKVQASSSSNSGLLVVGGVAVVAVIAFLMMGSGKSPSSAPVAETKTDVPSPKPNPAPISRPQPTNPLPKPPDRIKTPAVTQIKPPDTSPDVITSILTPPVKKPDTDPAEVATTPEKTPKTDPATKVEPETPPKPDPAVAVKPEPAAAEQQAEIAYVKFLIELVRRTSNASNTNLSKVEKDSHELAAKPEYTAGKDLIAIELKDLESAAKYEAGAFETMTRNKKTIDLPADHSMRKFGSQVKVEEYDSTRGLSVSASGAKLNLTNVPPQAVLEAAAVRIGPLAANYLFYRNERAEVQKLLTVMNPQDRPPFERKLELLKVGDVDGNSRAAYANLLNLKKNKKWKEFLDAAADFEKKFGETPVAQEKSAELAAMKEFCEDMANPIGKIFNAKSAKQLPDGFVELVYDFSTPQQLKLFTCEQGDLTVQDGVLMVPRSSGQEYVAARFNAPLVEFRHMEITGKGPNCARFGISYVPPSVANLTDLNTCPRIIMRPYNQMAHLEGWDSPLNANRNRANAVGTVAQNWARDVNFAFDLKTHAGGVWTIGGEELSPVKLRAGDVGGTFAFWGTDGGHSWTNFKIIFKPDPAWLAKQKKN